MSDRFQYKRTQSGDYDLFGKDPKTGKWEKIGYADSSDDPKKVIEDLEKEALEKDGGKQT